MSTFPSPCSSDSAPQPTPRTAGPPARVLTDVLALSAVAAGPNLYQSAVGVALLLTPSPGPAGLFAELVPAGVIFLCVAGGGLWLVMLLRRRCQKAAIRRAAVGVAAMVTVWALADRGVLPGLGGHWRAAEACLCLWLVLEVLRRHGIGLPAARRRPGVRWQPWAVGALALAAVTVGGALAGVLASYGPQPVLAPDEVIPPGIPFGPQWVTRAVWAGVVEGAVLTAVPVLLLRAAGAPRWQWVALPVLLRIALHLQFGLFPAVAHGLTAAALLILLVRYRYVLPLVVGHAVATWPFSQLPLGARQLLVIGVLLAGRGSFVLLETAHRSTASGLGVPLVDSPGSASESPVAVRRLGRAGGDRR
ncbi:hypothetical protein ACIOGT_25615 [Streptomyces microflavus]|uniref:hypothetical protein n=1 Tax=Streptomyces microflavus TaxID=1919 RepID=UPI0037F520B9